MSGISDAYDALVTRITAALGSGWTRIPNAYDLADNSDNMLRKGWALAIGPAVNGARELSCNFHLDRDFVVSVVRENIVLEHDAESAATTDKTLMEDMRLILKDFETNSTLNTGRRFTTFVSDSGIEAVRGGNMSFLALRAQFNMKYVESLNT